MIGALSFLTIFGRGRRPDPRQQFWFPLVGAAIGAAVGLVWWGASQFWNFPISGGIALVADLVITGLLHMDGLADSADGLLAPMDRPRRLAVMKQPDVGAFGVVTIAAVLLMRFATLGSLALHGPKVVAALAGLWALSRGVMVIAMNVMPYARADGGLASAFGGDEHAGASARLAVVGVITLVLAVAGLTIGRGLGGGLVTVAAGVVGAGLVLVLAQRRLGGYTGDVLGAAGVMAEVAGLLALTAHR